MKKIVIMLLFLPLPLFFLFYYTNKPDYERLIKEIGSSFVNKVKDISILTPKLYVHDLSQPGTKQVGSYKIIGSIKDPLLLKLVNEERQQFKFCKQQLRGDKTFKAIILDGEQLDSRTIKQNSEVKKSINESIPIVISKPTNEEVEAIIGAKVGMSDALVIVPQKNGEEFEIHLIHPSQYGEHQKSYFRSSVRKREFIPMVNTPELDSRKALTSDGRVQVIKKILNTPEPKKKKKKQKDKKTTCSSHKKWTVREATPYYWGDQKQYMDIGYEYNLYYVVEPQPARKYLTIKTVGSGVSPGKMKHDKKHHKGFYQKAVTVSISKSGAPLFLEASAPETENSLNSSTSTVSTGVTFYPYIYAYPTTGVVELAAGGAFSITWTKSLMRNFNDFSISADADGKWTYWLSGAEGSHISRKNTAKDLVHCSALIKCKIRELPQLANGSRLMPHMESVYYTDGNAKGDVRIIGKTTQYLQDVKLRGGIFKKVKNKTKSRSLEITIPLQEVGPTQERNVTSF